MSASNKVAVIVTGASRGFGRALACVFAREISSPVHFVLSARTESDLAATLALIKETRNSERSSEDTYAVIAQDLSDLLQLEHSAAALFASLEASGAQYDELYFLNNAGSMGPLTPIGNLERCGLQEMKALFDFNITSSTFVTTFLTRKLKDNTIKHKSAHIVNVSSLCAVQAFASWGTYCAGKAARDMFHAVLAAELTAEGLTGIKTLNYAPGPMDTNMQKQIREDEHCDEAHKQFFVSMKEEGKLVVPENSAHKLYAILAENKYVSGSHVDFYD